MVNQSLTKSIKRYINICMKRQINRCMEKYTKVNMGMKKARKKRI